MHKKTIAGSIIFFLYLTTGFNFKNHHSVLQIKIKKKGYEEKCSSKKSIKN